MKGLDSLTPARTSPSAMALGYFLVTFLAIPNVNRLMNMHISGLEIIDQVTLGELIVANQSIGVAELALGFDGVDGILGYVFRP